jgi:hypothetical protein
MTQFTKVLVAAAVTLVAGVALAQDKTPIPVETPEAAKPAQSPPAEPAVETSPAAKAAAKPPADGKRFKTVDKMELDATSVTGNRELPKVLYIVPWKKADLGDLVGKPMNSLVDEVLAPVDRDVFKRQLRYYGALQPDKPATTPATESKP